MGVLDELDLGGIADERVRTGFVRLLNLVEDLKRENAELRAENQRLRDEINRLKGEQGKPKIKGNSPQPPPANYSSEQERSTPKPGSKGAKTTRFVIDREQTLEVDRAILPPRRRVQGARGRRGPGHRLPN